jgi:hypothetical protein
MTNHVWRPGDGAEQTDSSLEAAQRRVSTGHWTAEERSDEDTLGFDAAYLTWRESHGSHLDSDYRRWREESGKSFSEAFLEWAKSDAPKLS